MLEEAGLITVEERAQEDCVGIFAPNFMDCANLIDNPHNYCYRRSVLQALVCDLPCFLNDTLLMQTSSICHPSYMYWNFINQTALYVTLGIALA